MPKSPGYSGLLSLIQRNRARLPKKSQAHVFFQIDSIYVKGFQAQLNGLLPLITTTAQVQDSRNKFTQNKRNGDSLLTVSSVNIAFSHEGLTQVGFPLFLSNTTYLTVH